MSLGLSCVLKTAVRCKVPERVPRTRTGLDYLIQKLLKSLLFPLIASHGVLRPHSTTSLSLRFAIGPKPDCAASKLKASAPRMFPWLLPPHLPSVPPKSSHLR